MGNHLSCISLAADGLQHPRQQLDYLDYHEKKETKKLIKVWKLQQHEHSSSDTSLSVDMDATASRGDHSCSVMAVEEFEVAVESAGPVVRAGDVMVEHPGHFLCCVSRHSLGLTTTSNFNGTAPPPPPAASAMAVPADQELQPSSTSIILHHVYLLLPMARLRTRFSHAEIQHLRRAFHMHQQQQQRSRFQTPRRGGGAPKPSPTYTAAHAGMNPPPQHHDATSGLEDDDHSSTNALINATSGDGDGNHGQALGLLLHSAVATAGRTTMLTPQYYSRSRSWIPRLETITEVSVPEYNQIQHCSSFSHHMQQQHRRRHWAPNLPAVLGTVR